MWLFDYSQGAAYEAFSISQDVSRMIEGYLLDHYDLKGKTILEIGAGSGKFTSTLSKECSKLYVVEKSASLMQINRNKNYDIDNIDFVLSDMKNLTMEPKSIDIIFAGWSLTSMKESFDIIFDIFKNVLRNEGMIILVENAGNDEFCKIMDIDGFTSKMKQTYIDIGFIPRKVIDTTIKLSHEDVFYNAFPNKMKVKLSSLDIQHKVLIMEMQASALQSQRT